MSRVLILLALCSCAVLHATPMGRVQQQGEPPPVVFECGTASYDDGSPEDSIFFGGGRAGDPKYFMGVLFNLADFGLFPHQTVLNGFCVSNYFSFSGGPWPNELFVFRDINGLPDLENPIDQATIVTGDGAGTLEIQFDPPIKLSGDFWLIVRGDPMHEGEDFNLEIDLTDDASGHSYLTDLGINFLHQTGGDWLIRADLQGTDVRPVPALGHLAALITALLLLFGAFMRIRSHGAAS